MNIDIKLNKNFINQYNKLTEQYGTEFSKLNGFSDEQLSYTDFIDNFIDSKTTSDASIDGNANVGHKDIVSLESEMSKPHSKLLAANKIFHELNKKYGFKTAKEWLEAEWNGDFYLHDFFNTTYKSYCFAYDLEPLVNKGVFFMEQFNAEPPKHLYTYTDFVGEFVSWCCNRTSGAVGLPNFLIYSYYFWKKDCESGYVIKNPEYYKKQNFQEIIYRLNQPFLRSGQQCVDESTRILTPNGFKKYEELHIGDEVYTWKNGALNINPVQEINITDYKGEMHQYSGRDITQLVSPNHRIIYQKNNSNEFRIDFSDNLINRKTPLSIPVAHLENNLYEDYPITDEELKLLTIILCDGYIEIPSVNERRISISKSLKRGVKEIEELLEKLEIKHSKSDRLSTFKGANNQNNTTLKKQYKTNFYRFYAEDSKKYSYLLNDTKKDIPDWFLKLSKRQANIVINTWATYDGNTRKNKYNEQKLQCDNYIIAEKLQHLCFLGGRSSKINSRIIGDNKKPTIYLSPYNRKIKNFIKKEKIYYEGKIWCPTTEDGVVVFEKNGAIFISGNSAFTNFSIFDKSYLVSLFGGKQYPDGTYIIDYIDELLEYQKDFMEVVSEVRSKNMMTFPVLTYALFREKEKFADEDFAKWCCKHNMKWADSNFFISKDITSLSNCCRLVNNIDTLGYFNSIGGTALEVGSVKVNTINLAKIAYANNIENYLKILKQKTILCLKSLDVIRHIIERNIEKGLLPNYSLKIINLKSQYNTIGIIGLYEALQKYNYVYHDELGYTYYTEEGIKFAEKIFQVLKEVKSEFIKDKNYLVSIEQIPGERAAAILMAKDKLLFPEEKYDLPLYGNQFIPLGIKCTLQEKIRISALLDKACDGGSISHINLSAPQQDFDSAWSLLNYIADQGVQYFAFCTKISACKHNHGFFGNVCPICGEEKETTYQRIVGFLTPEKTYSKERKAEFNMRDWFSKDDLM